MRPARLLQISKRSRKGKRAMILLTSDGITSQQLLDKIRKSLPHVTQRAALVVTASDMYKERDENVPILTEQMAQIGLDSTCYDVEFENVSGLLSYDVIILMGGNPFYLRKHLMKWQRAEEILRTLGKNHVLVGISAGSMVLGRTMEFVCPIDEESVRAAGDDVDCNGFGIVPYNIFPHNKAYLTVYPGVDELLAQYQAETGIKITTINDREGILIARPGKAGRYISSDIYEPEIYASKRRLKCDNYIFDVYGTLIDIHTDEDKKELWEKMARFYSYKEALYEPFELKECYEHYVDEECSLVAGNIARNRYPEPQVERVFARLFAEKGVEVSDEIAAVTAQFFRALSMEYIRLYYGVKPLLERLRAEGKRLFILSNAQQVFTEYELKYLGIYDMFDAVYLSSDSGTKKPDRGFFRQLLKDHELEPEHTMMIGNSAHDDIIPARALGLATCYIRSNLTGDERKPICDIYMKTTDMPLLNKIL